MIRRNSSKASKRHPLGRSKSTSFVPRTAVHDLVTIEPRNAHRDAHIAATLSYERAQTEAAIDELYYQRLSNDLHSQSSSRKDISAPNNTKDNLEKVRSSPSKLQRRQSVRFAGPSVRQPRKLVRSTDSHSANFQTTGKESDYHAFRGRKWRSEGSNQRISGDKPSQNYNQHHPIALQPISNPISIVSSVPLGTRRLRKSRSMFVPFQSSAQETSGSSFDRLEEWLMPYSDSASDRRFVRTQSKSSRLRGPKSMSFLRPNLPKASSSSQSSVNFGPPPLSGGVSLGDRSLKSHSSMLFLPKNKKRPGLIGSMRNSSNNTDPLPSTFPATYCSLSKSSGFRHVANKASVSLKKKLKGIFKRKKESEDVQGQSFTLGSDHGSLAQTDISAHEEASISRVRSHVPSLHSMPSGRCPHSRRGSLESAEDDIPQTEGERSRVTSWTNSSTNASQITRGDWERQRLSVINEGGNSNAQIDNPQPEHANTTIHAYKNNQRIYSALVKRLDEMNRQQSKDKQQTDHSFMSMCDQNREVSPSREQRENDWTSSTIRCVQGNDDVFRDDHSMNRTKARSPEITSQISCQISKTPNLCSPSYSPSDQRSIGRQTPTRSSAFFGSPSNHLFRTQSPYRKVLRQNMKSQQEVDVSQTSARYLSSLSTLILPVRMPSPQNSGKNSPCASVDSIYSCQTESLEANDATSDSIVAYTQYDAQTLGEKSIEQEEPKPASPSTPTRHRAVSATSSVEWKTWLSVNVSKLETPPSNAKARRQSLMRALSTKAGHVREDAEIDSPVAEGNASQAESPDMVYGEDRAECQTPLSPLDLNEVPWRRRPSVTDENSHPNALRYKTAFSKEISSVAPLRIGVRAAASLPNVKSPRSPWSDKNGRVHLANSVRQSGSFASTGMEEAGRTIANKRVPDSISMQSSPGITNAIDKQFGSTDFKFEGRGYGSTVGKQFHWPDCKEAWNENQNLNAQAMGSRRMVDLFLSSKQKRHDISQPGETTTTAQSAFL